MATISTVSIEEATSRRRHAPSERTLLRRRVLADADLVVQKVGEDGAAKIEFRDEARHVSYFASLRREVTRLSNGTIVLSRRLKEPVAFAHVARQEDTERQQRQRELGRRLAAQFGFGRDGHARGTAKARGRNATGKGRARAKRQVLTHPDVRR